MKPILELLLHNWTALPRRLPFRLKVTFHPPPTFLLQDLDLLW